MIMPVISFVTRVADYNCERTDYNCAQNHTVGSEEALCMSYVQLLTCFCADNWITTTCLVFTADFFLALKAWSACE